MSLIAWSDLLAAVPKTPVYVSFVKVGVAAFVFTLWALIAQWVDKDTIAVNTFRVFWNLIVIAVGVGATATLFLVPIFWVGLLVFVAAVGTLLLFYVVHRNALVREDDKVFTAAHLQRKFTELTGGKKHDKKEVRERVRVKAADGRVCQIPTEDPLREQYRLVQDLLFDVRWNRAELAELAPTREQYKVTYEIDGIPAERAPLTKLDAEAVLAYMKTIAGLSLEERRKPQVGKIRAAIGDNDVQIEVRTDGSVVGEKLSLRVVGPETRFKVADLGFTDKQLEQVRGLMATGKGLMLISGPADSGATTTIYSFTRSHDAFLLNIQMLEYEKELPIDNVTQLVFEPADNKTFTGDLQKLLRTDPDIVILPQVREQGAAVLATEAATKKQMIYVAIPASDALSALRKWLELSGDASRVAGALIGVMNQRLVRKLCTTCKQGYKPDPDTLRKLNMPADRVLYRQPDPVFDKHGNPIICPACQGTAYVGRTAVFELLVVDDALRTAIARSRSIAEIQAQAVKQGGVGLQKQALQKVLDGTTSIQEVSRVLRGGRSTGGESSQAAPAAATAQPRPANAS